jgi:putative Mg2+ transporter-C (MgtC) family protein
MIELEILVRAGAALLAGGVIGLERSYHGRAAGVRTYALVCFGAALIVAALAVPPGGAAGQSADVSRVVQGIVTGIGFLGAGVIVREGFTVRGLTTAASVWVTAAVGVLLGMGTYLPAGAAVGLMLAILSVLRNVEARMPQHFFVHCQVSFPRDHTMDESRFRELVGEHGFQLTEMSYKLSAEAGVFQYRVVLWSTDPLAPARFSATLSRLPDVVEYRLSPSRD